MPTDRQQPRAVETLRNRLAEVAESTGVFAFVLEETQAYFRSPDRQRAEGGAFADREPREPGEHFLPKLDFVLVRRRTLDEADSGVFMIPFEEWGRRKEG